MVDTGTPIYIIDERTFAKFREKITFEKCNTRLYGYKAAEPLPVFGEFFEIFSGRKSSQEKVVVFRGFVKF